MMGVSSFYTPVPPTLYDTAPVATGDTAASAGSSSLASRGDHRHAMDDTGWITPTYANGWYQYHADWGMPQYRKVGPRVFLKGLIKNDTSGNVTLTMFTLPAGFRPAHNHLFCVQRNPNVDGRIDVRVDGQVVPVAADIGWTSLFEINYMVA